MSAVVQPTHDGGVEHTFSVQDRGRTLSAPVWYAVYTRPRHEKVLHAALCARGVESFLPLRCVTRQWSDRRKLIAEPLFKSYVFVRLPFAERWRALVDAAAVQIVGSATGEPWEVPAQEISALQRFVAHDLRIDPYPYLREGQRVRIRCGALAGIEGFIVRKRRDARLVISVHMMMQSVAVSIDPEAVEVL